MQRLEVLIQGILFKVEGANAVALDEHLGDEQDDSQCTEEQSNSKRVSETRHVLLARRLQPASEGGGNVRDELAQHPHDGVADSPRRQQFQ